MEGVILGMPGPWADSSYEAADVYTTKIGGLPDWPFQTDCLNSDLLKCTACGRKFCLLAQVYAPIQSKSVVTEDRVIYVFGCFVADCKNLVWKALRVQRVSANENSQETPCSVDLSNNSSDGDDDGETEELDLDQLMSAFSEVTSLTCGSKKKKCNAKSGKKPLISQSLRAVDDGAPVLPCFYIHIQEERHHKKVASESANSLLSHVELDENSGEESYAEEMYEYDRALHADRTYLKFIKRLNAYPEQCIRRSYGGKPLLASAETGDPGFCNICRGARHFEMQLMPPIIYFLQEAADDRLQASLEKFDWITLLVYTCSSSCCGASNIGTFVGKDWIVAEETVLVQHE